ncbi:MAG: hypothetical protein GKR91_05925 [Pseudomonadales bacterium]|nr:hypothetical protein [Pseudomonadales bacterium]
MNQQRENLPVEDIEYDITNPRIAHIFEDGPSPNSKQIERALRDESTDALRRSIKQAGKIGNPIKVVPIGNNKYRVFEGNTRLSIYKRFNYSEEVGEWDNIPAFVYDELDEQDIDEERIQDHLVGTHPWGAFAKAKYLYDLLYVKKIPVSDIAAMCGLSQGEILRSVDTYKFMSSEYRNVVENEELEGPDPDPFFNEKQFTAFEVYISRKAIQESVNNLSYSDKHFARWVAQGLFTRNEDVRVLSEILSNKNALKVFLKIGSKEAKKLLDSPELSKQLREASLVALCKAISEKVDTIPNLEIQAIKSNQNSQMQLQDAKDNLTSYIKTYLDED